MWSKAVLVVARKQRGRRKRIGQLLTSLLGAPPTNDLLLPTRPFRHDELLGNI
jgi:hypothetical protein